MAYNFGRFEMDTHDASGREEQFAVISNTTAFLCQRGLMQWGRRVVVARYEAHDVTRGLAVFGAAVLSDAVINRQSSNRWSDFPGAPRAQSAQ